MDNQATYTLKHMYTGQRDHHKNVVIQYDADGKSCEQCMGNKKKDVLELFIRGKITWTWLSGPVDPDFAGPKIEPIF